MTTELQPSLSGPRPVDYGDRALRRLSFGIALSVLILAGSFSYFLFREIVPLRRQIDNMTGFLANHELHTVPIMRAFREQLETFARTNPDFRPILGKYIVITDLAPPTPAAPIRSAPPAERGR